MVSNPVYNSYQYLIHPFRRLCEREHLAELLLGIIFQ